ncbi:Phage-like element PBSX protein, XkdF [uncultured Caudovirales phage]|uniref:Phage-like element PBSX protein, XkdF n=1 Tax=uncultured Caudovirales phage TaxID=2100421 RepID=A0A6J5RC85_9CAUD|nr:Phage-like element PBSX protein, XkdF [uncultured Caudovirales phage]
MSGMALSEIEKRRVWVKPHLRARLNIKGYWRGEYETPDLSLASNLLSDSIQYGGSTRTPSLRANKSVTSGIAVSEHVKETLRMPVNDMTLMDISKWVEKHQDIFSDGRHFVGAWISRDETEDGKPFGPELAWLDIVTVYPKEERARAIAAGIKHNQRSIYDIDNGIEIVTGGTGMAKSSVNRKWLVGVFSHEDPQAILDNLRAGQVSKKFKRPRILRSRSVRQHVTDAAFDRNHNGLINDGTPDEKRAPHVNNPLDTKAGAGRKKVSSKLSDTFRPRKPYIYNPSKKVGEGDGSEENPFKVDSASKALEHIAAGHHVEMDMETAGTVLIEVKKFAQAAKDAEKAGDNSYKEGGKNFKDLDLCRVSVPDQNLFCAQNKGIPRIRMPQVKGKNIKENSAAARLLVEQNAERAKKGKDATDEVNATAPYMKMLADSGIQVGTGDGDGTEMVDASFLRASQQNLVGEKIGGMMGAYDMYREDEAAGVAPDKRRGFDPSQAAILVSSDGYVIDGHHTWAAVVGTDLTDGVDTPLKIKIRRVHMPIMDILDLTNSWLDEFGISGNAATATNKSDPTQHKMVISKKSHSDAWLATHPNKKSTPKEIVGHHGHRPHGPSILWPALYEELRKKGMTKGKAAAISNAGWKKKRMGIPTNTPTSVRGIVKNDPPCIGCGDHAEPVANNDDFTISKLEDDKQIVFGWAYTTHDPSGEVVVDKSGDFIDDPGVLEDAAYSFVLHSRMGGQDHARDGDSPVVKSTMVESMVFTPEKAEAMGIPQGIVPTGWWVGFKVEDDRLWSQVKDGRYQSFSIHGSGVRTPI